MDQEENGSNEEMENTSIANTSNTSQGVRKNNSSSGGSGRSAIANKIKEKATKEASKKVVAKKAIMMFFGHFIAIGIAILLGLIVLIGIAMFFVTMPGMVMEKLKALGKAIGDAWASWFGGDDTARVDKKQVYEVMDYIEDMGYNLKEHGFLTHYLTEGNLNTTDNKVYQSIEWEYDENTGEWNIKSKDQDITHEDFKPEDDTAEFDEAQGVFRSGNSGNIIAGCSDFIMQYIISDNYMYTIRNFNVSTDNWWEAVFEHIASLFSDDMSRRRGMILLLYDSGDVGKVKVKGGQEDAYDSNLFDKIELDTEKRTLKIRRGWFNTAEIEYDLDGWTGRYGMPLEFLLSVHAATLMPDLAYDMTQRFDTSVRILLHETNKNTVSASYKTDRGAMISKTLFSAQCDDSYGVSTEDAANIINNLSIYPSTHGKDQCGCKYEDVEYYRWNKEDGSSIEVKKVNDKYMYVDIEEDGWVEVKGKDIEDLVYTGTRNVVTEACEECRKYIDYVWQELKEQTKEDFKTYYPYIESVRNHWYRDVYFAVPVDSELAFVKYDYDYEALMRERWTEYEIWEEGDPSLPNDALIGKYKLYKVFMNSEGNFEESDTPETNLQVYETYEADRNQGDDLDVKYVKRAVTVDLATEYEDLYWNLSDDGQYYTAYETQTSASTTSARMYTDEDLADEENELRKEVRRHIYADLTLDAAKQTGDGLRTETNKDIKQMFLLNRYFRYDGSTERAEQITQLREELGIEYGALNSREVTVTDEFGDEVKAYQNLSKAELNSVLDQSIEYKDKDGRTSTVKVKDVSGSVQITQDSINAFSMLENTHTLDADFIYRDFKELIVELGFFTKEELMESIPRVMEFPVPEIGSAGYPNRIIDKKEQEMGTMIHSKGDINAAKSLINYKFSKDTVIAEDKGYGLDENGEFSVDAVDGIDLKPVGAADDGGSGGSKSEGNEGFLEVAYEVAEKVHTRTYLGVGETHYVFPIETYSGNTLSCSSFVSECLYQAGFEDEISNELSPGQENIVVHEDILGNCSQFVNVGIEVQAFLVREDCYDSSMEAFCSSNDIELIKMSTASMKDDLAPGDICFDEDPYHTYIFVDDAGGTNVATLGFPELTGGDPANNYVLNEKTYNDIFCAVRIFDVDKKDDGTKYEGYLGNEAVVAPMSGVLLEYGTYTDSDKIVSKKETNDGVIEQETYEYRENVDLKYPTESTLLEGAIDDSNNNVSSQRTEDATEKETVVDKVGYAKILVLDAESMKKLEYASSWNDNDLVQLGNGSVNYPDSLFKEDDMEDWNLEQKTVYGFKEFAENYDDLGLNGFVIYIDGFVCELPDESGGEADAPVNPESETEEAPEKEKDDKDSKKDSNSDDAKKARTRYDGEDLSMEVFKEQTLENLKAEEPELDERVKTLYKATDFIQLASKSATERINAENKCKEAAFSIVSTGDLVFVKEGAVIGRTMSDIESNDATKAGIKIRKNPVHEYSYYRTETNNGFEYDDNGMPVYEGDRIIGNYLRCMFYDNNLELIENIEDYMKLDGTKEVSVNFNGLSPEEFMRRLESMSTPTIEEIERAAELNGLDKEYVEILMGTTFNEGYIDDPYLYYGWCSAMINNPVTYEQMRGWEAAGGSYYTQEHIREGYDAAIDQNDTVMKAVYLALTERNEYINECDGMIAPGATPSNYNCIYDSEVYNCRIYEITH